MKIRQEVQDFISHLGGTGGPTWNEFRDRIDTAGDDFLDEFLRQLTRDGKWRTYALEVRESRRLKESRKPHPLTYWAFIVALLSLAVAAAAWLFPRSATTQEPKEQKPAGHIRPTG